MLTAKKTYYSISEVCSKTGLEQHVLRYWESEFGQLRPKKNRAGNRAYREKDIELINYIKYLLYDEHYTIAGAKKRLAETKDYELPAQTQLPLDDVTAQEEKPQEALPENPVSDLPDFSAIAPDEDPAEKAAAAAQEQLLIESKNIEQVGKLKEMVVKELRELLTLLGK